jgi:diacylglycerol kinase (ATP)
MLRALVVVNPVAGKGRARRVWQRVEHSLGSAGTRGWRAVLTERPGHARELARSAAMAGFERVIAVGGDGTVCEVANGLASTDTALGIVPGGTGDDCARNLNVPTEPTAAMHLALNGAARPIDLGEIETDRGRSYFVNVAGFGFDAEVAWRVSSFPRLVGGTLPYVLGVLQTLGQLRSSRMRIGLDGQSVDRRVLLAAVANGASYGGGMRVAPEAVPDDGLFDVCVIGEIGRLGILRLVPKMYSGGHRSHPAVAFFRCRELRAESDDGVRCQADGELVGGLPASFRIHPGGLRCVTGRR